MSSILSRPVSTKRASVAAGIPAVPQVNLLPPEYGDRQRLRGLQRRLLFALVVVLAFAGAAYGAALVSLNNARSAQAKAEQETTRLLQAQQQYAEVPQVLGALQRATEARELGMSTEIEWAPYIGAVFTVMPEGMLLGNISMTGATPMLAPAAPSHPLQGESVAVLSFEGVTDQLVDTADWVDALNAIPGFEDAWVSTAAVDEYKEQPVYRYSSTVRVTDAAYADRFAEED